MWHFDSDSRPQVSLLARTLERTEFALPPLALSRIIEFAASSYSGTTWYLAWTARTGVLYNFSLVSRACWRIANPILYRDIGLFHYTHYRHEKLVQALNSSCLEPLSINTFAPHGHGNHIRLIMLEHSYHAQHQATLFQSFKALLEWSPSIRFVCIYNASTGFRLPSIAHSSTTMKFYLIPIWSITRYISIFQGCSYLQRLIIREHTLETFDDAHSVFERLSLPCLIEINVRLDVWSHSIDIPLFTSFSTWSMPRLQFFTHSIPRLGNAEPSSLLEFLGIHGHKLQHLSATITDSVLSDVLRNCDNLRSAHFAGCTMATICDLLTHPTLETIDLHIEEFFHRSYSIGSSALLSSRHNDARQLKANAWINLPRFTNARVTFSPRFSIPPDRDIIMVTFSAVENYITLKFRSGESETI